MQSWHPRRPSPALLISVLALFVALGGTVYAASSKINGNTIKTGSIPGNRLKKHSVTGTQINLAKLGTVPNATNSTNSTSSTNATNAANLAGLGRFRTTISPSGTSEESANVVTLYSDGPLSLVGKCWMHGPDIEGEAFMRSSVAGYWSSYDNSSTSKNTLTPGTDEPATEEYVSAEPPKSGFGDPYDGTFAAIAADRSAYFTGLASVGVNLGGSGGCTFAGWAMSS
jgi:hypothetical protein